MISVGVFAAYILGIFFLAIAAYAKTHKKSDFLLANRELGPWAAALSAGASDMSGWLLLGLPGLAYVAHLEAAWLALGLAIGTAVNWKWVAGPLQSASATRYRALTLPEYFAKRYPDCGLVLSIFSSILMLTFYVFYITAGFVAAAKLFIAVFPLSYFSALQIGASVVVFYTLIGGFRAVVSTDCVQAVMMFSALLALCVMLITSSSADTVILLSNGDTAHPSLKPIVIISALAWGLGYPGQPHILARFMATQNQSNIRNGARIATAWTIACLLFAVVIGVAAANHEVLSTFTGDPEQIFITSAQQFFHPFVAAALSAAVLAAIMSTADSQLLIAATALFHDLGKFGSNKLMPSNWLFGIRLTIIAVASLSFVLAINPQNSVLTLVSYAWAGFGATLGPAVILSLYSPKTSGFAVFLGMATGTLMVVILELQYIELPGLYSLVPAFFANFFAAYLYTKLSNRS